MSKRQRMQPFYPDNPLDSAAMHYVWRIYNRAVHTAVAKELHEPENQVYKPRKQKKALKKALMRITYEGIK